MHIEPACIVHVQFQRALSVKPQTLSSVCLELNLLFAWNKQTRIFVSSQDLSLHPLS